MLTFEQIKELIDQVASHGLSGIELERSGFRLRIDGQTVAAPAAVESVPVAAPVALAEGSAGAAAAGAAVAQAQTPPQAPAPSAEAGDPAAGSHILSSPIVGTFYRSPNPDSPPFAAVGDRVKAGQILCIVEAMKLMNEIESDVGGTIVKAYVENAQAVEYGEPLFAIKVD